VPSVEEGLDRVERGIAYLRGVVEQLDKRFSGLRSYVEKRFEEFERGLTGLREYVDRGFDHAETEVRGWEAG